MTSRHLLIVVGAAVSLLAPASAWACPWNVFNGFQVAPPCQVLDGPLKSRITQTNAQIVAHLGEIAEKLQQVEVEVNQWNNAYTRATNYQDKLNAVYGDLTANPLPSLVASYNSTGIASYVRLGSNGWALSLSPIDIRQSLDSMHDALGAHYEELYSTGVMDQRQLRRMPYSSANKLDDQLKAVLDYQAQTAVLRDSLNASAARNASRYDSATSAGGDAEAKLSDLSAAMSRLRGTAFDAQGEAVQARQQALDAVVQTKRDMRTAQPKYAPSTYVF